MRKVLFRKWIPREMEPVIINKTKVGTGCWSEFIHEGYFHQWGTTYEEMGSNVAVYSIAIIEIQSGTIEEVRPTDVKFVEQSTI